MSDFARKLLRLVERMRTRVDSMVARAVITGVDDAKKTQRMQAELLAEEAEDDLENMQPYGISFTPPKKGSEGIALAVGGHRSHTVLVCVHAPEKRPKNAPEETGGLYTKSKWRVYIDANDVVHIGAEEGAEFIAQAQKTQDQFDELRKRIDDLTQFATDLHNAFIQFGPHTHLVATAGSAVAQTGTAAPTTTLPTPIPPIVPPLGAATSVAATKGKVT